MNPSECRDKGSLINAVQTGQTCDYLFFWGHSEDAPVTKACLSQWYMASFEDDEGIVYPSAEHYMMACKARLFEDEGVLAQILSSVSPADAKKLGRKVHNFDDKVWSAHRFEFVVQGNVYKFGQNEALKDFLLATSNAVLVEASPRDRLWGIGMGASNEDARRPEMWRGLNLLGFALMETRQRLVDMSNI